MAEKYDVVLVGLGFANGILAYRLKQQRPDLRMLIVEKKEKLGGEYTWSFFATDLEPEEMEWVSPLIGQRWDRHEIIFPKFSRTLPTPYHAIPSENLYQALENLGVEVLLGSTAAELAPGRVVLESGRAVEAGCVFDGRGLREGSRFATGYQKFVGIDVTLEKPHNLSAPIIMDATVEQQDGFCFMYTLPWGPDTLMFEDTRYSETPDIDIEGYKRGMIEYGAARGWKVKSVDRVEFGCLNVPMEHDPELQNDWKKGVPVVGIRAGIFHPITSYAAPPAIRLAERIARLPQLESRAVAEFVQKSIPAVLPPLGLFHVLNRMLFLAAPPKERYRVLQYFYTKNDGFVARFYAGKLKPLDYLNLFIGVPPVNPLRIYRLFSKPKPVSYRAASRTPAG